MTPAKGFAEMKDSGIEWVGMIPAHWHIKVLFQLVSQVKNKNKDLSETNLLSLSYGKIKRKNIDDTEGLLPASFDSYNIIENNDIVLRLTDLQNDHTSLRVGRATERGIITSAYITIRPTNSRMSEYLYYLLHSFDIKKGFYGMGSGVRQGLNYDEVKMLKLPLPPLNEESAIAAYLDTQCAKIDEIIAQAKASIEDYKQWKASIIYEAVTKGLDPNVEMKDSGVEWIGEVPMRWKIVRLKYLLSTPLQYGANETGLPYDESLPRYIRITDITLDGKLKTSGMQSLSEEKSEGYILDDEDILLARSGATVGKAFYYRESYGKAAFAGYLIRAKINSAKALPKFIYYSTMSAGYEKWKETAVIQATIQNIGASRYNEYSLAIPPIAEQLRIIEFLDDKMEKIDSLMAEKQSLIDDLESYKKSLIYEVVTGKRRV